VPYYYQDPKPQNLFNSNRYHISQRFCQLAI
jgi:hypothetical protein